MGLDKHVSTIMGSSGDSAVKNLPANAGNMGSVPGSGRSPGRGIGNPLHYSCLENPTDRGAWQAIVHRVAKSRTRLKRLSTAHTEGITPKLSHNINYGLW